MSSTRQYMQFQLSMLTGLRARSEANESRLRNEINLVCALLFLTPIPLRDILSDRTDVGEAFNIVAQSQNQTTMRISEATQSDGAAMKTVALVTLTFLPATFVSVSQVKVYGKLGCRSNLLAQALFSMSFFDFSPSGDDGKESFAVSKKIWLYWVVVVPLTALTMGTWFFWQYRRHKKAR